MSKRNLFKELKEGLEEIQQHRKGKITLREYKVVEEFKPSVTPEIIREVRDQLHLSRAVFAHQLCISPRTLEKWEQGLSKPNMQAAALILLVKQYPDTLQRLSALAAGRKRSVVSGLSGIISSKAVGQRKQEYAEHITKKYR